METEGLWSIVNKYRGEKHYGSLELKDLNYISKLIPDKKTALNIVESNLFTSFDKATIAPDFITNFLTGFTENKTYNNALDPWANNGQFLNFLKIPGEQKNGYVVNEDIYKLNNLLNVGFNQVLGNPQDLLDKEKRKFDLIISNLPVGFSSRRSDFGFTKKDVGIQIIAKSIEYLTDKGQLIATVGGDFFHNKKFIKLIHSKGFKLSAVFETPVGSLNSSSRIPFYFIVIEKGEQENVFLAEIIDDVQHQKSTISNYNNKKSDKTISKGIFKPVDEINSITKLLLFKEVDLIIKKTGLPLKKFTDFGDFKKLSEINAEDELILIPTFLSAKAKKGSLSETIKENAYHLFVVNTKKSNTDYLLKFINSELAKKIMSKYAKGFIIPSINKSMIREIELPIPEIATQKEVINLERKLEDLKSHFNTLQGKLWKNHKATGQINKDLKSKLKSPDNIEWLEDLPFPLASIYWGYHSESSVDKKVDYLFLFFEGLCEFLDTLILSGLNSNKSFYESTVKEWLRNEEYKNWHEKSSFGGWHNLFSIFSKRIRKIYNANEEKDFMQSLFSNANADFFNMITSSTLTKVFAQVSALRNNFKGHGGVISDSKLSEILSILETHFYEIKPIIVNGFSNIQLFTVVPKSMNWNEQDSIFETTCKLLKGTRSKFNQVELKTNKPLTSNKLYLMPSNQFNPIELLPFVQMRQAPKTEHNACYFYNRIEGDKVRLVSYHYDKEEEVYIDLNKISSFLDILNPTN